MSTKDLARIIYRSTSLLGDETETVETGLANILETARKRNIEIGVSGALIFLDGVFVQVLEGPPAEVEQLMETIASDPRHTAITTVERQTIARKLFPRWPMAFLSEPDVRWAMKERGLRHALDIAELPPEMVAGFLNEIQPYHMGLGANRSAP